MTTKPPPPAPLDAAATLASLDRLDAAGVNLDRARAAALDGAPDADAVDVQACQLADAGSRYAGGAS